MVLDAVHGHRPELAGNVGQVLASILFLHQEKADGLANTGRHGPVPIHRELPKLPIYIVFELYLRPYHAYRMA